MSSNPHLDRLISQLTSSQQGAMAAFLEGFLGPSSGRIALVIPEELLTRIEASNRISFFAPNDLIIAAAGNNLDLGTAFVPSELSNKPGYLVETMGAEHKRITLRLTHDEIARMARRALEPREVVTLVGRYGLFHEVHDDFYDETGHALQPH
jgi:hypothetical protein